MSRLDNTVRREKHPLDRPNHCVIFSRMSILQVKQTLSRMSQRERREIQLYLLRLKRETPAWKRATAKKIREMQAGRFTSIEQLEARLKQP